MNDIYFHSLIIDTDYHRRTGRLCMLVFNDYLLILALETANRRRKREK